MDLVLRSWPSSWHSLFQLHWTQSHADWMTCFQLAWLNAHSNFSRTVRVCGVCLNTSRTPTATTCTHHSHSLSLVFLHSPPDSTASDLCLFGNADVVGNQNATPTKGPVPWLDFSVYTRASERLLNTVCRAKAFIIIESAARLAWSWKSSKCRSKDAHKGSFTLNYY